MKVSVRNNIIKVFFAMIGAIIGIIIVGLPIIEIEVTYNGVTLERGFLIEEEINSVVSGESTTDSYLKIQDIRLIGKPFYWMLSIISFSAFLGYMAARKSLKL